MMDKTEKEIDDGIKMCLAAINTDIDSLLMVITGLERFIENGDGENREELRPALVGYRETLQVAYHLLDGFASLAKRRGLI